MVGRGTARGFYTLLAWSTNLLAVLGCHLPHFATKQYKPAGYVHHLMFRKLQENYLS